MAGDGRTTVIGTMMIGVIGVVGSTAVGRGRVIRMASVVEGSAPVVLTLHTIVDSPADWAVPDLVASAQETSVEGTLEVDISLVEAPADSTVAVGLTVVDFTAAGGAKTPDCY